jgi:putative PIN family toxin of toxin-antitoxin system
MTKFITGSSEYERALARPYASIRIEELGATVPELVSSLFNESPRVVNLQPIHSVQVRDAKDTLVLATAVNGHADYLVTGDADLLELTDHPKIRPLKIVRARAFLDVLARPD